ncbi:hypothetical protein O97_01556 [Bartonella henselae str. Zeus]|uniref:hypothetical protein n=1 Tax=Bartonella henselae TaxID=38323 RepID=UPI0003DFAF16|nr:hypothetical protein Q653_00050 [Bartonella henselae JK 42]ETS11984.1 hypothetical protein Q652_01323 [Bartonella henselae JK 41]KEC55665.1 hypothetical protein O97_01556 [Bartonella henselae str. Zeus]KEC57863.1 hypothetical protein O95_01546 [Bartonella henselae JK 53]OLL39294.1 hypothetical protein AT244_07505 [Bartonella henselae]
MLTSFGKILRKLRIDHSERFLDMAKNLYLLAWKKRSLHLYDLGQEAGDHLRRNADIDLTVFYSKAF